MILICLLFAGLLSWNASNCHVNLEEELNTITIQALDGEEGKNGKWKSCGNNRYHWHLTKLINHIILNNKQHSSRASVALTKYIWKLLNYWKLKNCTNITLSHNSFLYLKFYINIIIWTNRAQSSWELKKFLCMYIYFFYAKARWCDTIYKKHW